LGQARNDISFGTAQIQVDRPAVGIVKDDDGLRNRALGRLQDGKRDLDQWARNQSLVTQEGGETPWNCVDHRSIL
jgi:hypothetical protein